MTQPLVRGSIKFQDSMKGQSILMYLPYFVMVFSFWADAFIFSIPGPKLQANFNCLSNSLAGVVFCTMVEIKYSPDSRMCNKKKNTWKLQLVYNVFWKLGEMEKKLEMGKWFFLNHFFSLEQKRIIQSMSKMGNNLLGTVSLSATKLWLLQYSLMTLQLVVPSHLIC